MVHVSGGVMTLNPRFGAQAGVEPCLLQETWRAHRCRRATRAPSTGSFKSKIKYKQVWTDFFFVLLLYVQ